MIKFSEMQYERPDIEALKTAIEDATRRVEQAKSYEDVKKAYFDLQDKRTHTFNLYTIAHVRNTINTADAFYDGEMRWLREQISTEPEITVTWFVPDLRKEGGACRTRTCRAKRLDEQRKTLLLEGCECIPILDICDLQISQEDV